MNGYTINYYGFQNKEGLYLKDYDLKTGFSEYTEQKGKAFMLINPTVADHIAQKHGCEVVVLHEKFVQVSDESQRWKE